ncbi:hypothetical protein HY491_04915 [Candidatus Woesearchaeota archaeon]|nr:hypothetical protein [Candidatus Woesearchaeota archaeon]
MSKRKYKQGIKNEIHLHKHLKLESARAGGNTELERYYEKEIKRLEEQLVQKERKLLPRKTRMKS